MKTYLPEIAPLLAFLLLGCAENRTSTSPMPDDFPNLLNLQGAPDSARDLTAYAFSDLGSWAMYGLPDEEDPQGAGSFPGPLLLRPGGLWLSPSLVRLDLQVDGEPISLSWAPERVATPGVYPGLLRQELVAGPLALRLELVFAAPETVVVTAMVRNQGEVLLDVSADWIGGPFFLETEILEGNGAVALVPESLGMTIRLEAAPVEVPVTAAAPDRGSDGLPTYRIAGASETLGPGREVRFHLRISVLDGVEDGAESEVGVRNSPRVPGRKAGPQLPGSAEAPMDPDSVRAEARRRWSAYLSEGLGDGPGLSNESGALPRRIAVKAMQTLLSNWRGPAGGLRHHGLFPSYAYRGFHGFWSWDSWKHARALAFFAPELAREQVRAMLDHQGPDGMIPDVIYVESSEDNWRDTKPPLAAWAVEGIFRSTADTAFVQEVLPALVRYHRWWYLSRDHDHNGLCEYGSTDGTRIAAAWESGMDNAVRFDRAIMVPNGPGAWSLSQESVDLNAYLFAEKGYLADLLRAVGRDEEAEALREEARELGGLIRTTFFDEETGFFYDVDLESKAPIRIQGPEGWIPLWAGVANRAQAEAVAEVMLDPGRFSASVPLPTLAMDHPAFDPADGYWRGPVWLDQAYFGIHGLARYGMAKEARSLARRIATNARGLVGAGPIFENYHPVTGVGLNAPHFSWSAAHLLLLYREGLLGAGPDQSEASPGGEMETRP